MKKRKRAVLIDGKNAMYYVEHHRSDVDVVYSFLRRVAGVLEYCPGIPAVVWERTIPGRGKTTENWRESLKTSYEYKGNRELTHHARFVIRSMPFVSAFLAHIGIPQFACPFLEADDLIGLLAGELSGRGWSVAIVSNDRDYYQLVDERIVAIRPGRDGWQTWDAARIEAETGVPPSRWALVRAVAGDVSDNIQPVRGIGMSTARQYVLTHGLDPSRPRFSQLPEDVRRKFQAFRDRWPRFHEAYCLGYLARDVESAMYPAPVKSLARRAVREATAEITAWEAKSLDKVRKRIVDYYRGDQAKLRGLAGLLRQ